MLLLAVPVIAQQSPRRVVVHAGHALDVKTGKLLSDETFIIEDGRIVSAGPSP
jgi:imidazolonepropionase-like amidohydrolase